MNDHKGKLREPSNEVELTGICMPAGHHLPNSASSLLVGHAYSNNMATSGRVRRIVLNVASGVVTIHMITADKQEIPYRLFLFPTGMTAEEKRPE